MTFNDILPLLRLKNIFNPSMISDDPMQGGITGRGPTNIDQILSPQINQGNPRSYDAFGSQQPSPDETIEEMMNRIYRPETQATDEFNALIKNMPQRPENQGLLRKIAAIGLGTIGDMYGRNAGGGQTAFSEIMYPDYRQKLFDWNQKVGPAKDAANLERSNNINERTMAYQTATNTIRERELQRREAKDKTDADLKQQKQDLAELKYQNPNLKFDFDGPTVLIADPHTGKITDSKVPTGALSQAERMKLQYGYALQLQDDRQAGAKDLKGTPTGNATVGANGAPRAELPLNAQRRRTQTANDFISRFPQWADYLAFDESNNFTQILPKGNSGKMQTLKPNEAKMLLDTINGKKSMDDWEQPTAAPSPTPTPTPTRTAVPPTNLQRTNVPPPQPSPNTAGGRSGGPALPQSKGPNVLSKTVRNKVTGEIITVYSRDGGKTWERN